MKSILLSLQRAGANIQCLAPDMEQTHVINHLTNEKMNESRQVLIESARIARGNIKDIKSVNASEFDAAVYPGGFGAALNLCNFGIKGADHELQKDILKFAKDMAQLNKPQGFVCIAPALIAKIYGPGIKMTIGSDKETALEMEKMGNIHQSTHATYVVLDEKHKVLSTPAYMMAQNISEVFEGVENMVKKLVQLI